MVSVAQEKVLNTENVNNTLFRIKTFNKISKKGLEKFSKETFEVSHDIDNPDAYVLRSQSLHDHQFPLSVKAIGRAGAGVNNIPVEECSSLGIVVFNTPGANANAVKELVVVGLLLSARDIIGGIDYVRSIEDQGSEIPKLVEKNKSMYKGIEISGKTLGVIGLGAIGLQVANAGLALGLKVQGYDPFISVDSAWELSSNVDKAKSVEKLIKDSDFISVHVPYNEKTKGFLNAQRIKAMKSGAVVLNFSRNELVDEAAMIDALNSGAVHKYVTDFPNPLLIGNKNVISIPHLGASTKEAEDNCAVMVANQVNNFLNDGTIVNSVNFPTCHLERSTPYRLTIVNQNIPKVIGMITSVIADTGTNISEMVNKSFGDIAYNIIDFDQSPTPGMIQQLSNIEGVVRVTELPSI